LCSPAQGYYDEHEAEGKRAARAYELLGKELGMFRDAIDHTHKNLDPDPSKWTKEQLEQVIKPFEEYEPASQRPTAKRRFGSAGNADFAVNLAAVVV
jgi:hypothetical protein